MAKPKFKYLFHGWFFINGVRSAFVHEATTFATSDQEAIRNIIYAFKQQYHYKKWDVVSMTLDSTLNKVVPKDKPEIKPACEQIEFPIDDLINNKEGEN